MDPSAVRFSFEGADAYHLQGDHAFETPELLEARERCAIRQSCASRRAP